VTEQPGQHSGPEPDDAVDRTQGFPAYAGQPGDDRAWQSYPPIPPAPASPWAYEPPGGGGYPPPSARDLAWPRQRRSGRPWLIVGAAAALLAAAAVGGIAGHALGSRPVAAGGPSGSGGASTLPGIGSGSGVGNGSGVGTPSGGTGNGFGGAFPGSSGQSGQSGQSGSGQDSQGAGPSDAASIAARVDNGLVDVNTTIDYGAAQAAGTGMVLTSSGEVLTNNHVVEGATTISVTDVGNGKTYQATVVGYSVTKDVAVLRLTGASGLQTVSTATSAASSGEQVVGIGNAGGTGGTPSYAGGTITATSQSLSASDELTGTSEHLTGMLETNADIESGDSGGPLVNAAGQVLGMDTAGSQTFQFNSQSGGTGFAIPISTATSIAAQITAAHASSIVHVGPTAFLGVQISQANSGGFSSGFGNGGAAPANGVQISGVVSGSPAAGSGLADGDVITAVAGHTVRSQTALQTVMVNDVKPGERVTVDYTDKSGQQHSVSVVLTSGPAN
jgi:S1-C subfamily serine protease